MLWSSLLFGQGIDYHWEDAPLQKAVDDLIHRHLMAIVYQPGQLSGRRTTATCRDCGPEEALARVLNASGLGRQLLGEQWIIVGAPLHTSIRGRVRERSTSVPLRGVAVSLTRLDHGNDPSQIILTSNAKGRFLFRDVQQGLYRVGASGGDLATFSTEPVLLSPYQPAEINLDLDLLTTPLVEQVLSSAHYTYLEESSTVNQIFNREEIERTPHLYSDAFRIGDHVPGVARGDLSANFRVRGGVDNETLILLDGAELIDPFHLTSFGFRVLSLVDSEALDGVQLFTGHFPVEYGNKMSGVLQLESRTPAAERHTALGVDFVGYRAKTLGRFSQGRGSYLVNYRHTLFDEALRIISKDQAPEELDSFTEDVYAKVQYLFSPRWDLSLHFLGGRDRFESFQPEGSGDPSEFQTSHSKNRGAYAWVALRTFWKENLTSRAVLGYSDSRSRLQFEDTDNLRPVAVMSEKAYRRTFLTWDWQMEPHQALVWQWGLRLTSSRTEYDYHNRRGSVFSIFRLNIGETDQVHDLSADTWGLYGSGRFRLHPRLTAELGVRADDQSHTDERQWSPRVHLAQAMGNHGELTMGWGRYFQPQAVHELQVEDDVGQFFTAERADHWGLGYAHRHPGWPLWRINLFYKKYSRLRTRYENFLRPLPTTGELFRDRVAIETQAARARGVELLIKGQWARRFFYMLNYTLSKVEDDVGGARVPRQWDQAHAVNLDLGYLVAGKWRLALAWQGHTGWRQTDAEVVNPRFTEEGFFRLDLVTGPLYARAGSFYHRLDTRLSRSFTLRRGHRLTGYLEASNLYDRENFRGLSGISIFADANGLQVTPSGDAWIPRVPSLGIQWVF